MIEIVSEEPKKPEVKKPKQFSFKQIIEKPIEVKAEDIKEKGWQELGINTQILSAITKKLKFPSPSVVQQRAIPLLLKGKDCIVKAQTGSGKTLAYAVPAIQMVLREKKVAMEPHNQNGVRVLIIVPSYELGSQVHLHVQKLSSQCAERCTTFFLGDLPQHQTNASLAEMQTKKNEKHIKLAYQPQIVIGTPEQFIASFKNNELSARNTAKMVIIDEADLILDKQISSVKTIFEDYLPPHFQCVMISATLQPIGLVQIKNHFFSTPVLLECTEKAKTLMQYYIKMPNNNAEKILYVHSIVAHTCQGGKVIIFINEIKDAYELYTCLRNLGISKVVVLSPFFPLVCRYDIIDKFNSGQSSVLITMDSIFSDDISSENFLMVAKYINRKDPRKVLQEYKESHSKEDFNMARGIDFQKTAAVINFDLPSTPLGYTHRIGRTARGGNVGISISFVTPDDEQWPDIVQNEKQNDHSILPFVSVQQENVDRIRYRFEEMYVKAKKITKQVLNQAHSAELKNAKLLKLKKSDSTLSQIVHQPSAMVDINAPIVLPEYLKSSSTRMYELEVAKLLESGKETVKFEKNGGDTEATLDTKILSLEKQEDIMSDGDEEEQRKKQGSRRKLLRDPLLQAGRTNKTTLKTKSKKKQRSDKIAKPTSRRMAIVAKISKAMKQQSRSGQWATGHRE